MAKWRSPSTVPVHIALLSGHAVVIGPDGVDLHPLFESAALAAGCLREPETPNRTPKAKPVPVVPMTVEAETETAPDPLIVADGLSGEA